MHGPKITNKWGLLSGFLLILKVLFSPLTILLVGIGLMVGSLIAISITSGMLAITIIMLIRHMPKGPWLPLEPTFMALGVEGLILVISIAMYWFVNTRAWWLH